MDITGVGEYLRSSEGSCVALVQELQRRADVLTDLGVYITRFDDQALEAAASADAELSAGIDRGPMHGVPVGIKDIFATIEGGTTAQSLAIDRVWLRPGREATAVARLRDAGAVILGKTTTMEFAIRHPGRQSALSPAPQCLGVRPLGGRVEFGFGQRRRCRSLLPRPGQRHRGKCSNTGVVQRGDGTEADPRTSSDGRSRSTRPESGPRRSDRSYRRRLRHRVCRTRRGVRRRRTESPERRHQGSADGGHSPASRRPKHR